MVIERKFIRKTNKKTDEYEYIIECDYCKNTFKMITANTKSIKLNCSKECYRKAHREKISKGLTKYYSENDVWNKGLSKEIDERVKRQTENWLRSVKKTWSSDEYKNKMSKLFTGKNNPFYNKKHDLKAKEKMSNAKAEAILNGTFINNTKNSIKGHYQSLKNNDTFYYESAWELIRMKMLDFDEDVLKWTKKHKIKIQIERNGERHYYIPDFLIEYKDKKVLEEVKGYDIFKKIKFEALIKYANENNLKYNFIEKKQLNEECIRLYNKNLNQIYEEL